jgi:hypothetical protein
MTNKTNTILAAVIVIALVLSVIVLVYVNLPKEKETNENELPPETETPLLTITFNGSATNYALEDLEAFDTNTGSGSYYKVGRLPEFIIEGPYEYTGINLTLLLEVLPNLPENYSIIVTSSDNYTTNYTFSQIQGTISVYNESGNITSTGGVTLLLAYKEAGEYISDPEIGPLRLAYVDDGSITPSNLWAKMVISIEIIEQ